MDRVYFRQYAPILTPQITMFLDNYWLLATIAHSKKNDKKYNVLLQYWEILRAVNALHVKKLYSQKRTLPTIKITTLWASTNLPGWKRIWISCEPSAYYSFRLISIISVTHSLFQSAEQLLWPIKSCWISNKWPGCSLRSYTHNSFVCFFSHFLVWAHADEKTHI